jgi:hypothetical protein
MEAGMRIELTEAEGAVLRELLARAFTELREEVHKTEAADWKRALKAHEQVINGLIAKLRSTSV